MQTRGRVLAGVALFVAGAAIFELPGAWLYARGAPWWAALAVAAALFPVGPAAWHLLGERARRRRLAAAEAAAKPGLKPKPGTLTGGDRFTLRLLAVGLIALGPLLFFRGGQTWRAVRHHPAWFVPRSTPAAAARVFHGDPRLLAQVPADAELVVWARRLDGLSADDRPARRDPEDADEVLLAYGHGQALLVVRGPDRALSKIDVAEINTQLGAQAWLPIAGPVVARRRAADLLVVVSQGWAQAADDRDGGRAGGPVAIAARLAMAPDDAVVITAAAPTTPSAGLTGMQSWLRVDRSAIRIDAQFFMTGRAAVAALVARAEAERGELATQVPADCRARVAPLLRDIVVVGGDTSVRIAARWRPAQVGEAVMCGLGALMKHADWK